MAPRSLSVAEARLCGRWPGDGPEVTDKTDYSPVVDEPGEAQKRRERRKWSAFLTGAHAFWVYALVLAAIVLLVIWLT
jgi:hypothetical protein